MNIITTWLTKQNWSWDMIDGASYLDAWYEP